MKKLLPLLTILIALNSKAQTIRYVSPLGAGSRNGLSWANAAPSNRLQLMITASSSLTADQVWVAAGTYTPTHNPSNGIIGGGRDRAFLLKSGTGLYGGFTGTETAVVQANPTLNVTTLSGDFTGDDVITFAGTNSLTIANNTTNAYHVVISASSNSLTVLDGFTVKGGCADYTSVGIVTVNSQNTFRNNGAGLYNINSSTQVNNCGFTLNTSINFGGGIYNENSNSNFIKCNINNNLLQSFTPNKKGAGIYQINQNCNYTNCSVVNNIHDSPGQLNGIGLFLGSGSVTITNSFFSKNLRSTSATSINDGGAIFSLGSITIRQTIFNENVCQSGGAIHLAGSNNSEVSNCIFIGNIASIGGAIRCLHAGTANIINNTFFNNNATTNGGGLDIVNGTNNLINNIFYNNTGGGNNDINGTPTSAINNQTQVYTGGIGSSTLNPVFTNSINPIGADGIWFTADDGLQLTATSPCVNTGTTTVFTPTVDALLTARPQNCEIDRGAYEYVGTVMAPFTTVPTTQTILYVKKGGAGLQNGSSWANAMPEVAHALHSAHNSPGNTVNFIWVATGSYTPVYDVNFDACASNPRERTFLLKNGVRLVGGFAGVVTETNVTQANPQVNPCILSGDFNNDDGITGTGNTFTLTNINDNAYHVLVASNLTLPTAIFGFTVTGGNANDITNFNFLGWGIKTWQTAGGGLLSFGGASNLNVLRCTFTRNVGFNGANTTTGGAISLFNGANAYIESVVFNQNYSTYGAGVRVVNSNPILDKTVFCNNKTTVNSVAIGILSGQIANLKLYNSVFYNNRGVETFAFGNSHTVTIQNCTFFKNSGTAVFNNNSTISTDFSITNCIFKLNGVDVNSSSIYPLIQLTYSTFQTNNYGGIAFNNNTLTASFVNTVTPEGADGIWMTADDGLQLSTGSPCIDNGNNAVLTYTADILNRTRIINTTVDRGAYEFNSTFVIPTYTVLPIELLYFTATPQNNNQVNLNWATASELNNAYFTILKSSDGLNWQELGQVTGAGTSNQKHSYELIDTKPYQGISYYQLKQTDFSGKSSYSKIVDVNFNSDIENPSPQFVIYPNPAQEMLNVELQMLNEGTTTLEIINAFGQIVLTENVTSNNFTLKTDNLKNGIYIVKITSTGSQKATNNQITKRLIINR